MQKILTISIPTWNRERLLDNLLDELTRDITKFKLEDKIEILVSNNDSKDSTDVVIKKYKERFNFITYNKNKENIGGKSNVLKSMELATTPFVIFFGDDDRVNISNFNSVIEVIEKNSDAGVVIDTSISKFKYADKIKIIDAAELAGNFYWFMGNAGCFIVRTEYVKTYLSEYGYDFFNECWPQTQLMLLGLNNHKNHSVIVGNFSISSASSHSDVMVYSSFYLWRTVVYDLRQSIENIKNLVSDDIYKSALRSMKKSSSQNFLNLLQCGVFIDDKTIKQKTINHIRSNIKMFKGKEKVLYFSVAIILALPSSISKLFSDIFIYFLKGKKGIDKKNNFVKHELGKKVIADQKKLSIRELEFEK